TSGHLRERPGIEPATAAVRPQILREPHARAVHDVAQPGHRPAAVANAGFFLHDAGDAHAACPQPRHDGGEEGVDGLAAVKVYGRHQCRIGRAHESTGYCLAWRRYAAGCALFPVPTVPT